MLFDFALNMNLKSYGSSEQISHIATASNRAATEKVMQFTTKEPPEYQINVGSLANCSE